MFRLSRLSELVLFDVCHAFTSMRSSLFIIPYMLFWYLVLTNVTVETLNWLQSAPGLFVASWWLEDQELALQLLIDRSPTLSIYLYVSTAIMPVFILFAANNQFSSDRTRGAFRFVLTRCTRQELFLSRFLSSLLVAVTCIAITCLGAIIMAGLNEEAAWQHLVVFGLETFLLVGAYSLPFVAFMTMTSALAKTAMGNLFLAMMLYSLLVFLALWFQADSQYAQFLVPGAQRPQLYDVVNGNVLLAVLALLGYTTLYVICGWLLFRRQDV